jgi:hypothetical protein
MVSLPMILFFKSYITLTVHISTPTKVLHAKITYMGFVQFLSFIEVVAYWSIYYSTYNLF